MLIETVAFKLEIQNQFLPRSLKRLDWDVDEKTMIPISVSPTGNLRRKQLVINSPELALQFEDCLRKKFQKRKYHNAYNLSLIVNPMLSKNEIRWMDEDSQKIQSILEKSPLGSMNLEKRLLDLEDQISDDSKAIYKIRNEIDNDRLSRATVNFFMSLKSSGYDFLKETKSPTTFKKYMKILMDLGFTESELRNRHQKTNDKIVPFIQHVEITFPYQFPKDKE